MNPAPCILHRRASRTPHLTPRTLNVHTPAPRSAPFPREPAKTMGSFILSMGSVPFTFAILARKLELDLRRTQVLRF